MARNDRSKVDNMDFRFALVDTDGVERYPFRTRTADGQFGFLLGRGRDGGTDVVQTIEDVVKGVVFDGKQVRTSDFPPSTAKGSSGLSLARGRNVQGYRIAPSLRQLVTGAITQPMGAPAGASATPLDAPEGALARRDDEIHIRTTAASVAERPPPAPASLLKQLDALSVGSYFAALRQVEPAMTSAQREMLRGHANAPDQEFSMQDIAAHGGYADYATANIQYGRLGRMFAEALSFDANHLANKVQAICIAAGRDDDAGHFVWRLRPQLAEALNEAGWNEPNPDSLRDLAAAGAAAEVTTDEKCQGLPETTRRALINARIGQGGFRQRMLKLWNGQCAVTGLGIQEALTASHAKAWEFSDNGERLDEFNGLLLSASVDRLFDRGLISFSDDGRLLVQPSLDLDELQAVGLTASSRLQRVPARCRPYLEAHRRRFKFGS